MNVPNSQGSCRAMRLIWGAYGLSGASALAYEVVWSRHLQLVLGSSVYAVSATLAAMMAGLALGGAVAARYGDGVTRLPQVVAALEVAIAAAALISFPLLNWLPDWHLWIYRRFMLQPVLYFALDVGLCLPVVLLPTSLMGATFPLIARLASECGADTVARAAGGVYAANTVGAIAGSLLAGFVWVPLWGLWGAMMAAAVGNLLAAALVLFAARVGRLGWAVALLPVAVALGLGSELRPPSVPVGYHLAARIVDDPDFRARLGAMDVVYERWTVQGVVQVREDIRGSKVLIVDGRIEGASRSSERRTQDFLALAPSALRGNLERVFVIGLGTGRTAQTLRGIQDRASIQVAEINPAVIEAVETHFVPGIDEVAIASEGRVALAASGGRFDAIISSPSFPVDGSSANLFTTEFYGLAKEHLTRRGVLIAWLPGYLLAESHLRSLLAGVMAHFENVALWRVGSRQDLVLAAAAEPLQEEALLSRCADLDEPYWELGAGQLILDSNSVPTFVAEGGPRLRLHRDTDPWLELTMAQNLVRGGRWVAP